LARVRTCDPEPGLTQDRHHIGHLFRVSTTAGGGVSVILTECGPREQPAAQPVPIKLTSSTLSLVLSSPDTLTCKNMLGEHHLRILRHRGSLGSTPPDLHAASLEGGGSVWSAPDYASVLPMDHDPPELACVAENADAEPVEHRRVDTREREGGVQPPGTSASLSRLCSGFIAGCL